MTDRRTALAATLCLAVAVAACGGGGGDDGGGGTAESGDCPVEALADIPADDPVTVTLWAAMSADQAETMDSLAAAYNDSQDKVDVKVENAGGANDELLRKFTRGIPTGDIPEIAIFDDTVTQFMADSGVVMPAQACIDAEQYDTGDWLQPAMDSYTIDGALYPASANLSTILFYFNKNHFVRAGLDPNDPPGTLAEVREAAEALKAAGVTDKPLVLKMASWLVEYQLTGDGAPVVNENNGRSGDGATEAAIDNPQALELYTWLDDMVDDGLLDPKNDVENQYDHFLAMANQQSSMSMESSGAITAVVAFLNNGDLPSVEGTDTSDLPEVDPSALDIGAAPIPGLSEPGQVQVGGNAWYMTNTGTDEQLAATWDFLKWINQPAQQVVWNLEGSYIPFNTKALDDPELQDRWQNTLSGQWLALANEQVSTGLDPDFPGPLIGPYAEFRSTIRDSLDSMVFEEATPDDAIAAAASAITASLEKYADENF